MRANFWLSRWPVHSLSRSAYYAWLERPQTAIETDDAELIEVIKTLFKKSRKNYVTRRIKEALTNNEKSPGSARETAKVLHFLFRRLVGMRP